MEERLTRVETIVEYHEKLIADLQDHVRVMNHELGEVNNKISSLSQAVEDMKREITNKNKTYLTILGFLVTVVNIVVNLVLAYVHP